MSSQMASALLLPTAVAHDALGTISSAGESRRMTARYENGPLTTLMSYLASACCGSQSFDYLLMIS
jgi:hypothetical protein